MHRKNDPIFLLKYIMEKIQEIKTSKAIAIKLQKVLIVILIRITTIFYLQG